MIEDDFFVKLGTRSFDNLEGPGGPEGWQYIRVMEAIRKDVDNRIATSKAIFSGMQMEYRHTPTGHVVKADNHDHAVELIERDLTVATDESRSNGGGRAEVDPADVVAIQGTTSTTWTFRLRDGAPQGRLDSRTWQQDYVGTAEEQIDAVGEDLYRYGVSPTDVIAERDALFSCEGFEGVFKGRTSGQLWNGWECPRFTREQAERVLKASRCVWEFKDGAFQYTFPDDDGPATCSAAPDGLFPIGSHSWCWELDEEPKSASTTGCHTPEPWYVIADPIHVGKHPYHDARYITTSPDVYCFENAHQEQAWAFENPRDTIICTLPDSEHQAANSRLIKASPKLLAALKRLVGMADLGEVDLEPEEQAALDNARALIQEVDGH